MKKIRITDKDMDALAEAADFISSNSDGADDVKYYNELQWRVERVWIYFGQRKAKRRRRAITSN